MNLLEHYIKEVISVEPYEAEWTKEFDKKFVKYIVVADCWGDVRQYENVVRKEEWDKILEQGYFWS